MRVAFAVALMLVCVAVLYPNTRRSKSQSGNLTGITVINQTQSLEVVGLEKSGSSLLLHLKNISLQDLNEYSIGVSGHGRVTKDLSFGNRVIAPGKIDDLEFIVGADVPAHLTVFAAAFTDGTIEGDDRAAKELRETRWGLKMQLTRALPAIEEILNSPDVATPEALERLESRITSLSADQESGPPFAQSGYHEARDRLLREVQSLRAREQHHRHGRQARRLLELKESLTKMAASL